MTGVCNFHICRTWLCLIGALALAGCTSLGLQAPSTMTAQRPAGEELHLPLQSPQEAIATLPQLRPTPLPDQRSATTLPRKSPSAQEGSPVPVFPRRQLPLYSREAPATPRREEAPPTRVGPPLEVPRTQLGRLPDLLPQITPVPQGLELTVRAPSRAPLGGQATYRLFIRNAGDHAEEDVAVHCQFDEALQFGPAKERELLQQLGRLLPNETRELALTLTSRKKGTHCSRFSLTSGTGQQNKEALWKSVCVDFVDRHLNIDVQGPARRTIGSRAEFNINISNTDTKATGDLELFLTHDNALVPKEATTGAQQQPDGLRWKLGSLAPGEGLQLQVEFECASLAHRACVFLETRGENLPREQAEGCVEIVPVPGILDMRISDKNDPLVVGKTGEYEVTVQNIGLQVARQIRLEIQIPDNLKVLSASVSQQGKELPLKSHQEGSRLQFEILDVLEPDLKLIYTVRVEATRAGDAEVQATLHSTLSQAAVQTSEPTRVVAP